MKRTPSEEAAKRYLENYLIYPSQMDEEWTMLHKKHRLWIGTKTKGIIHVCHPTNLLHYINRILPGKTRNYPYVKKAFVGEVVDGSFWHTQKLSYRCHACKKRFEGGVAFAIRVGLQDKEKFE